MKTILIFLTLILPIISFGYTVVLLTDQPTMAKAVEVKQMLSSMYPFNKFSIDFKIVKVAKDKLDCGPHNGIPRLITCSIFEQTKAKMLNFAHQVITVADYPEYGGSGGVFPVITTNSPKEVALHELLHTYGFKDEYKYSAYESQFYCNKNIKSLNSVVLKDINQTFNSNQEALNSYQKQIPWYKTFLNNTIITHENGTLLGSGTIDGCEAFNFTTMPKTIEVGLYPGETCNNHPDNIQVWHPSGKKTIMHTLTCGLSGYFESAVWGVLKKKRAKVKISN